MLLVGGCSKDDNSVQQQCEPLLTAEAIICNPLAPAPGDTAQLTAQAVGVSCTSLPDFEWEVYGGRLIDTTGISVRWVVPQTKGVVRVFVKATLASEVDTMSKWVMIRDMRTVATGIRYSLFPNFLNDQLFFIGSAAEIGTPTWFGYNAYGILGTSVIKITKDLGSTQVGGAQDFVFMSNAVLASAVTDGSQYFRRQPMSIMYFPYEAFDLPVIVASPRSIPTLRPDENRYPSVSSDENMFVWQQEYSGSRDDGTADLVNIGFKVSGGSTQRLTVNVDSTYKYGSWVYRYWLNVRPMFSPDRLKILYFVDSTGTYEPCVIPLEGVSPILEERHAMMVDSDHGIFQIAGIEVGTETVFEWNPHASNELGFVDTKSALCVLDVAGEAVEVLKDVGKVQEFAWGADGRIAAVTNTGVSIVSQSGVPDTIFVKEKDTDKVSGIAWSPSTADPKVAFRLMRRGKAASESFSALVICSLNDHRWYYATPRIAYASELEVPYTYMRAVFEADNSGVYFPCPTPTAYGSGAAILRSY